MRRAKLRAVAMGSALLAITGIGGFTVIASPSDNNNEHAAQSGNYYHSVQSYPLKQARQYDVIRRYSGNLVAAQNSDLGFELAGKLDEVLKKEGQSVAKGDVIARLNTDLLKIEKQQLVAQYQENEARLALTQASIKRQNSLRADGFASEQRLDELNAERKAFQAALSRIQAAIAGIDLQIEKSDLIAPFDGVITRRYVDEGTVVNAGTSVTRIQQAGAMELEVGIPVRLAGQLPLDRVFTVRIQGNEASARLVALGADIDSITRTVNARFEVTDISQAYHGALAQVVIAEAVPADGFWIPAAAVTDGVRGMWVVYAMKAKGDGLFDIESRDVQILHATDDAVYVRGALEDGEQIVATGLHRLVSGQTVRNDETLAQPLINLRQSSL